MYGPWVNSASTMAKQAKQPVASYMRMSSSPGCPTLTQLPVNVSGKEQKACVLGRLPFPGRPEWSSELLALAWPNSRAWGVNQLTEERFLTLLFQYVYISKPDQELQRSRPRGLLPTASHPSPSPPTRAPCGSYLQPHSGMSAVLLCRDAPCPVLQRASVGLVPLLAGICVMALSSQMSLVASLHLQLC